MHRKIQRLEKEERDKNKRDRLQKQGETCKKEKKREKEREINGKNDRITKYVRWWFLLLVKAPSPRGLHLLFPDGNGNTYQSGVFYLPNQTVSMLPVCRWKRPLSPGSSLLWTLLRLMLSKQFRWQSKPIAQNGIE